MMLSEICHRRTTLVLAISFLAGGAPRAVAGTISFVDIFKNVGYVQTGNGATLSSNGAFFSADLNSGAPDDYSSVTMTYPGPGSPASLPESNPPSTDYHYQTGSFASQADMDAAFPTGTYTFSTNTGDIASLDYTSDDYSQTLPYLTGSDYSNLQDMNPGDAFTFDFSPFVTGGNPLETSSFIFFTIYDYTLGQQVYDAGFLPATTTSVTVPGGTLHYGDSFAYEIDFSDRDTPFGNGGTFPPQIGFETRTDGTFTAAIQSVPEPGTLILTGIGLMAAAATRRRARL